MSKYPPIENYPPLIEAVMRQHVPWLDAPLDWVVFTGTGLLFDKIAALYNNRPLFYISVLLWALPWFLVSLRLDRKGKKLQALGAFSAGWGGGVVLLMLAFAYFMQVTVLVTVVFPILAPFVPFLALCGASVLIDAKAPAWMGWLPRHALALAHRFSLLPKIMTPAAFVVQAK